MNRMQELYNNEVAPALFKSFGFKNVMDVPRIENTIPDNGVNYVDLDREDVLPVLDASKKLSQELLK